MSSKDRVSHERFSVLGVHVPTKGGINMAKKDDLVVGIDVGTTKICAIVGEVTSD